MANQYPDQLSKNFTNPKNDSQDFILEDDYKFSTLNTMFMTDGIYIHIPKNCTIEKSIHVIFYQTDSAIALHPRNIIIAEENASVTIIEEYISILALRLDALLLSMKSC